MSAAIFVAIQGSLLPLHLLDARLQILQTHDDRVRRRHRGHAREKDRI